MAKPATVSADGTTPAKKTRAPAAPKAIYAVIRVLNEDGSVMSIPKGQVEVISFERSAEQVLAKVESGEFPGALYLRGMLPAGR